MASVDSERFHALPSLTAERIAARRPGSRISLLLLIYTEQGTGITYAVEYDHREITYRTPGQKDAVAFGQARLYPNEDYSEVRILFSRPNGTATLKGLTLAGEVKLLK